MKERVLAKNLCFHCGEGCPTETLRIADKFFCCTGCQNVYSLLHQNQLGQYYCLNNTPSGSRIAEFPSHKFQFLDDPTIAARFISFQNAQQTQVTFFLPQIHCSSCLWLLEHLRQLNSAILSSTVNFPAKQITIAFEQEQVSLRQIAELLARIGYEPHIALNDNPNNDAIALRQQSRQTALQLGVVGFCFANIMLISFPEYLGLSYKNDPTLTAVFRYFNLMLSLPVLIIGARPFFSNALHSLQQKMLNIDTPIALAITITFLRSVYEIITQTDAGYLDSMSGIVFFMLIGRALQNKTYAALRFDRDYTSYFPIAVSAINQSGDVFSKKIQDIAKDDVLLVHCQEIIPVDALLSKGKANVDYSFITGENTPTHVGIGEILYAGGKVIGEKIEVVAIKSFSQNSFTQLWNNAAFKQEVKPDFSFVHILSQYFSIAVLTLALVAGLYWAWVQPAYAWQAVTAVLIVACPCALLLSSSFTNGFIISLFSSNGMFVKNSQTVEQLSRVSHLVFDKTGTLTDPHRLAVSFEGEPLPAPTQSVVLSLLSQSLHPLSQAIIQQFSTILLTHIEHFKQIEGKGIEGWHNEQHYQIGSADFLQLPPTPYPVEGSEVWLKIDEVVKGRFVVKNHIQQQVPTMLQTLQNENYNLSLLSGDNDSSKAQWEAVFPQTADLIFKQNPQQKLDYVQQLQQTGVSVLMVGDGLNDAGALQQSDVGIAIVENAFSFSPACDAVLHVGQVGQLHQYLHAAKAVRLLIITTFIYSLLYNVIGLYFALSAQLSPIVAAILMPLSSISIILISFLGTYCIGKRYLNAIPSA